MNAIKMAATIAFVGLMTQPALAANDWTIDPAHTNADFSIKHMTVANVRGGFGKVTGSAKYDGKDFKNASVEANIDASTIDTHNSQRDEHLKGPDFFDVTKYPTITFKSKSFKKTSAGFDMVGDLTMHGVTKPVTLHAEKFSAPVKMGTDIHIGTSATTKINRKDFGVSFNKVLDNGGAMLGEEVNITIEIDLSKKAETASAK